MSLWFCMALTALACACSGHVPHEASNPGETKTVFRRIGGKSFKPGTRYWIVTNMPPAGTILSFEADHEFDDGIFRDAVLVEGRDRRKHWHPADAFRGVWVLDTRQ